MSNEKIIETLQELSNNYINLFAGACMDALEDLYERGIIETEAQVALIHGVIGMYTSKAIAEAEKIMLDKLKDPNQGTLPLGKTCTG